MKRRELIRYLEKSGRQELRERSRDTVFVNPREKKASAVPRHTEINENLARKICRDLEIPQPH